MDLATSSSTNLAIIVPNVVAFSSVAVAAVAVYLNRKMTQDTLSHQLNLVHDERIWQQRSETYLELLIWLDEWEARLELFSTNLSQFDRTDDQVEFDRRTQAKVIAFGSEEIKGLAALWRPALVGFAEIFRDIVAAKDNIIKLGLDEAATSSKLRDELLKYKEPLDSASQSLEDIRFDMQAQIRHELQTRNAVDSSPPPELISLKRSRAGILPKWYPPAMR